MSVSDRPDGTGRDGEEVADTPCGVCRVDPCYCDTIVDEAENIVTDTAEGFLCVGGPAGPARTGGQVRRYPLAALMEATGLSEAALGRRVGLSGTSLIKARELGLVEKAADRCAVRCGLLPWLVWPEWLEHTEVECEECGTRFVPSRKGHTFCTERCYQRQYKREAFRRKYQTDPEFRAQRLAAAKRYRDSAKKALRAKQVAWKQENADAQREYRRRYYLANRERLLAKQREYDRRRREETA